MQSRKRVWNEGFPFFLSLKAELIEKKFLIQSIFFDYCEEPSLIIDDFLYLGNHENSADLHFHETNNITHLLGLCNYELSLNEKYFPTNYTLQFHDAVDFDTYNISQHFEECFSFLDQAKINKQKVLCFCMAGVSRSVTITTAYLMREYKLTVYEALKFVQQKRPCIAPNRGFILQLLMFEETLKSQK